MIFSNRISRIWSQTIVLAAVMLIAPNLWAGRLGPHLERVIETEGARFAGGKFASTFTRTIDGKKEGFAHVFIDADIASLKNLEALGAEINTVTSSGVMTAVVPVNKLRAIAAVAGVHKITAGQPVKKMMDVSATATGVNLPDTSYPRSGDSGTGAIVGVIDTGIDIEHPDFIDAYGDTRIIAIWDHTLDSTDVTQTVSPPAGFSYGTEWTSPLINGGYTTCAHRDNDGHGTHVAGTAAGNGSAPSYAGPYTGLAPDAELLIVKFDFDNEKNRNSDTAVVDAINWIFEKAAAAGKPCVINMSMGSDYGPHDGTTAEERGLDDLTGPGKIVCISAGNAGSSWEGPSFDTHGGPIHGSGNVQTSHDIVISTNSNYTPTSADDYAFFDIWYPGDVTTYVQITSPSGVTYPQSYTGSNKTLWYTDGKSGGFATPEGTVYVENISGANSFWEAENGDNNIYIEISDFSGVNPASGTWVVNIYSTASGDVTYHGWQGFSDSLKHSFVWYDSGSASHVIGDLTDPDLADNSMTIGKPATAISAISIGAYQTKATWPGRFYDDCEDPSSAYSYIDMDYATPPITYYNDFHLQDIAYFSSRGPSRDGRSQPFISAPGVGIVASLSQVNHAIPGYNYFRCMNRVEYGGYYTTLQGTSMSCPHATGSVAVLLGAASDLGITPAPADMKETLRQGARTDSYTHPAATDPTEANDDWGYGKIDVTTSLDYLGTTPSDPPPALDTVVPDSAGWRDTVTVTLSGSGFQTGTTVDFGALITVNSVTVVSESEIICSISVVHKAVIGPRDVTVINPDGQSATLVGGFTVVK
ncbi:S8 family serine peptidase [Desulfosediminicola ganghwensis]|uniref:S8 family serine peptidase n=1 Tax=Desulfosediminicola ganghwensis TaxID=2569540 RepID=UPI0010AB8500|nr:S8 family serine peptidase [Desulfosediminicola ganghwensis]